MSGWASTAAGDDLDLTDDELLELKRAFRQYDRDGSGDVKIKEMRALLRDIGVKMTEGEMNDYLDQVDADGSGSLDKMEFFKLVSDLKGHGHWSLETLSGKPTN